MQSTQRDRKPAKNGLPFIVAFLSLFFIGWAHITTNLLGTKLDQSIKGASATDQYVVTYDHASRSYKLLVGSGGGGGGAGVVGFFAKSKGVTQAGTPTTLDVDEGLTGVVTGSTFRVTPTYGTAANTFAQGNDSRLSDARTPTAHATSHKNGGSDEVATATAGANLIPKAAGGGKLDIGWIPTGTSGSTVPFGNDSRFTDARTPTAHATSHQNGGSDEVATATAAANAIPKAGSGAKLDIGWVPTGTSSTTVPFGNDSRFPPNPSGGTGGMVVFNAAATSYSAVGPGTTNQVLRGGGPSFGNVPLAAIQEVMSSQDLSDFSSGKTGTGASVVSNSASTQNNPTIADYLVLRDTTSNPTVTGAIERNGADVYIHDGTAARAFIKDNNAALTNKRAPTITSEANHDLMRFNGTDWVRIPPGTDGNVLTMVSGDPAWAAGSAGGSGSTLNVTINNGSTFSTTITQLRINQGTNVTVSGGFSGTTQDVTVSIPAYGSSASTITQGNDTRLPPAPSGAGKMLYDNASAYVALAAGTSSQILVGGAVPAFGNAPLAAITEVLALANLTDVTGKTGSGTIVVMGTSPTITTPDLKGFVLWDSGATQGTTFTGIGNGQFQLAGTTNKVTLNVPAANELRLELGTLDADTVQAATTNGNVTIKPNGSGTDVIIPSGKTLLNTGKTSNGVAYWDSSARLQATAAGTSSQVFVGGSPGAFGNVPFAAIPTGTSGSTVCVGNDSRLSDSRAPKMRITLVPGACQNTGATTDALLDLLVGTNTNLDRLIYDDTTAYNAKWLVGGDKTKDYGGGAITARIRWYSATTSTGSNTCGWKLSFRSTAAGAALDNTFQTARTVSTLPAGTTVIVNSDISSFTPTAAELTAASLLAVKLERDSPADAMTGNAYLACIELTED